MRWSWSHQPDLGGDPLLRGAGRRSRATGVPRQGETRSSWRLAAASSRESRSQRSTPGCSRVSSDPVVSMRGGWTAAPLAWAIRARLAPRVLAAWAASTASNTLSLTAIVPADRWSQRSGWTRPPPPRSLFLAQPAANDSARPSRSAHLVPAPESRHRSCRGWGSASASCPASGTRERCPLGHQPLEHSGRFGVDAAFREHLEFLAGAFVDYVEQSDQPSAVWSF